MIKNIIFDLSEVLISGLVGVEKQLAPVLNKNEDYILNAFGGDLLDELLIGNITEDTYIQKIVENEKWKIDGGYIKNIIRQNLLVKVEGMDDLVAELSNSYKLFLLSDHAEEWVEFILKNHLFLNTFSGLYFSYQIKYTKKYPQAFEFVLNENKLHAGECLFIDDSASNIKVAGQLGLKVIRFKGCKKLTAELNSINKN